MKKFIMLMILLTMPCVSISQTINQTIEKDSLSISPNQVVNVYKGLKQNESLKKEIERLKQIAVEFNNTIQKLNSDYQIVFDSVLELNSVISEKNEDLAKKDVEIEKLNSKKKRFSIGPSAGLSIEGKIYGGIGVNYALFRF